MGAKAVGLNIKLIVGVHCTTWNKFARFLDKRELFGSSISVKGFNTLDAAVAHVNSKTSTASDEVDILDEAWVDAVLDGSRGGFGRSSSNV